MIGTIARVSGRLLLGQVRGGTCKKEGIRVLNIYLLLTPGFSSSAAVRSLSGQSF